MSEVIKVSREELVIHLEKHRAEGKGKIFSCTFMTKDNRKRVMNCRFDVKSALKGGELKYDPASKQLMIVYDMQKAHYRSINLLTLLGAIIGHQEYIVEE